NGGDGHDLAVNLHILADLPDVPGARLVALDLAAVLPLMHAELAAVGRDVATEAAAGFREEPALGPVLQQRVVLARSFIQRTGTDHQRAVVGQQLRLAIGLADLRGEGRAAVAAAGALARNAGGEVTDEQVE